MNDDRRKMLTEYIGECWIEIVASPHRSDGIAENKNRTFTTWAELGAVKDKLVERKEWTAFINYAYGAFSFEKLVSCAEAIYDFTDQLFTPSRFCELAAEFLEGRHADK